jgi:class 3 adenylate cyclase
MRMPEPRKAFIMDPSAEQPAAWPDLLRVRRAIVVVDMVESVRLMREHEDEVIDRWRRFVAEVNDAVLPPRGGRMVKSLGDGMLLEFKALPAALSAAIDIQQRLAVANAGRTADRQFWMRAAVHCADVAVETYDLLGSGVNLAARLATLACPGNSSPPPPKPAARRQGGLHPDDGLLP